MLQGPRTLVFHHNEIGMRAREGEASAEPLGL